MIRISIIILIIFVSSFLYANEKEEEIKHFGYGLAWLQFDYPVSFIMDPKSHEGGAKWWAKFDSQDAKLSIEVDSFGFVPEHLQEKGFKGPREYVVQNVVGKNAIESQHKGYSRFLSITPNDVSVVYLDSPAEWGLCFQTLKFHFPHGEYSQHKELIDKVILSARPSFELVDSESND